MCPNWMTRTGRNANVTNRSPSWGEAGCLRVAAGTLGAEPHPTSSRASPRSFMVPAPGFPSYTAWNTSETVHWGVTWGPRFVVTRFAFVQAIAVAAKSAGMRLSKQQAAWRDCGKMAEESMGVRELPRFPCPRRWRGKRPGATDGGQH